MRCSKLFPYTLALSVICFGSVGAAQTISESTMGQLALAIEMTQSADWEDRRYGFSLIVGLDPERYAQGGARYVASTLAETLEGEPGPVVDTRIETLIELLEVENNLVNSKNRMLWDSGVSRLPPEDILSEDYTNYYGDVIASVVSLGDIRSIDALVGAIDTGGMARRTLVSFGLPAVDKVLKILESEYSSERAAAVRVISEFCANSEIISDSMMYSDLKNALLRAASDDYFAVRREAIPGLAELGDEESIEKIRELAQNDPYRAEFMDGRYLVREAAIQALN